VRVRTTPPEELRERAARVDGREDSDDLPFVDDDRRPDTSAGHLCGYVGKRFIGRDGENSIGHRLRDANLRCIGLDRFEKSDVALGYDAHKSSSMENR